MTYAHHSAGPDLPGRRRGGRRRYAAALAGLLLVGAGAGAGYSFLLADRGADDPQVVAATSRFEAFARAWEVGEARKAAAYTDTPPVARSLLTSVMTNLAPTSADIRPGEGEKQRDGEVRLPFTVAMKVPGAGAVEWRSQARLRQTSGTWTVVFSTPLVHPELKPGQTLALKSRDRAEVLDKNGAALEAASLVGTVDERTGRGTSGLEARYDARLSGGKGPTKSVVAVDRGSGRAVRTLTAKEPAGGRPVRTTIDPRVQRAAAEALSGVTKKAAIVAVDPRNGHILAAANKPGGLNRALAGRYPPGSTFKVVTAAALLKSGLRPSGPAACPKYARVDGQRFENQDLFTLPADATFQDAFARSCNTFFVDASAKLSASALRDAARAFGIGGAWDVGIATYDGSVPVSTSDNDKAAAAIGQARVQASPLVMASVAATVKNGSFRQPVLVPDAVKKLYRAPGKLDAKVADDLRAMMRATVTSGSGHALKDLPGQPHAKTGTAEFGTAKPPRTHAWMIGYQGGSDLAWAVFLEDGGSGGADAGPVAARFLKNVH
ncbi:PbsX family transcriptional regulator [Streptomyces sp. Ru73]|uniref:penicillin-binding transpeptidase domain-containing protein n=1 Tax=Streptomyces sp. Ru73 TaxID=2080748 RepID=UPI000CDDF845|nr:penicillin-binding transpeptidase domain-containing protein [Streptomyces sp. Ru73]POX38740.1 PbsX family transcriptional regulator [Streptomyces sp. Ru73]